jgi:HlyD family secretion protein
MKRLWRWTLTVILLLAAGAVLVVVFRPQAVPVDVAEVTRGPMQVTVEDDGQTRIRERYTISAPLAGQLQRIVLDPGDPVTANETLLAVIDPTDPALLDVRARAEAEARVSTAEAALARAEVVLERADVAYNFAVRERQRATEAASSGAAGAGELDEATMLFETAQQDARSAEFARDIARFELEQARAALVRTQPNGATAGEQAGFQIVAPVSGVVLRLFQESTAVVAAGTPLLEVGDPSDLEIVVDVLSTDAVRIEPGDEAVIERWGGGEPLRGAVRLVEPAAVTKISSLGVDEQRVNVIIDLLSPPDERASLGDAYRVEAAIVLWESPDALRVPAGALFHKDGQWRVFLLRDGRAVERPVEIGRRTGSTAQVLDGLEQGDIVVAYPSDRVRDGARVAPR